MRCGQPRCRIKINMIAELPLIQPVVLERLNQSSRQASDVESIDESQFYPAPGILCKNFRYAPIEESFEAAYFHFPALVYTDNNEPWPLGNLYLTHLALKYPALSRPSLKKKALSLVNHINFIIEEDLDIFSFPKRKSLRPTYSYSFHLREKLTTNPGSIETLNQHMLNTEEFYTHLVDHKGLKPANSMWQEERKTRHFINRHGIKQVKDYATTDLRLKPINAKRSKNKREKLRAYNSDEQIAIIEALLSINNTEMTLAFLTALMAGARMQSVFTIPRSTLKNPPGSEYLQAKIGLGSLIDAKYDSVNNIFLPLFLVEMMSTYVESDRYKRRDSLSYLANQSDNYLFLTKTGRPYYSKKNDPCRGKYKNPQEGGAVYAFIRNQLQPQLNKAGHHFKVIFHNLRATFANNVVNGLLQKYENNEISMAQVITTVSERLGHQSTVTTEIYIADIRREKVQALSQDRWERFLEEKIKRPFGGLDANDTSRD